VNRFARAGQEWVTSRELKEVTRTFASHPLHRRFRWTASKIACAFLTDGQHWLAAPEPRYPRRLPLSPTLPKSAKAGSSTRFPPSPQEVRTDGR
jgi:hypothetical protein